MQSELVKKCENSNLIEASLTLLGEPKRYQKDSHLGFREHIKKYLREENNLSSLKSERINSARLTREDENGMVLPYLDRQFTIKDKNKTYRTGHQIAGFHTTHESDNNRYTTYDSEIAPYIESFIEKINEFNNRFNVIEMVFCYVNSFLLPRTDFMLDKYFDLAIRTGIGSKNGVQETFFSFVYPLDGNTVKISLRGYSHDKEQIRIVVETTGIKKIEPTSISNYEKIMKESEILKDITKTQFFKLTSKETKDKILGAEYE